MSEPSMKEYNDIATRFIKLANEIATEGKTEQMVNAALMSASCIYATYVAAGNEGGLNQSGVEKVTEIYRQNLENVQKIKQTSSDQSASVKQN